MLATGRPVVVLTGEQAPDAQLMAASTVPIGIAAEAHAYLAHGGPANLEQLARFLSDTVLLTGHGFEPPAPAPAWGPLEREARAVAEGAPTVAVLYYRAHHMSGNTAFIDALCTAVEDAGARPLPLYVASLRTPESELIDALRAADAIVTTVLAAGGTKLAEASAAWRRRIVGRGRAHRARRADPPGALPHEPTQRLGGERRGRLAAGRGHPDRGAGVRRAADHRPLLLQGDRRGRAPGVRRRRRARGPGRRDRRTAREAAEHPERGEARRARALRLPDQALPDRERRRARHPRQRRRAAAAAARRGVRLRARGGHPGAGLRRRRRASSTR